MKCKSHFEVLERPETARYLSIMKNLDWSDLRIFIHVARGGGLSAAASIFGLSPATVGRRMLALEEVVGGRFSCGGRPATK